MALPPCFRLAETLRPRVRIEVAHRLRREGWSQVRTGRELGVSQAMVSKYLDQAASRDPLVLRLADEWLRTAGRDAAPSAQQAADWCLTFGAASADEAPLDDMLEAEGLLRAEPPRALIPQIGLNVARARAGAREPGDVLAFPGRLVLAGDKLVSPAAPAWGGSNHLARCLLALRKASAPVAALASVRGGPDVAKAARSLSWDLASVQRNGREPDGEAAFLRAAARRPDARAFHDAGALGIEPCLYVAGPDAASLARNILALERRLTT